MPSTAVLASALSAGKVDEYMNIGHLFGPSIPSYLWSAHIYFISFIFCLKCLTSSMRLYLVSPMSHVTIKYHSICVVRSFHPLNLLLNVWTCAIAFPSLLVLSNGVVNKRCNVSSLTWCVIWFYNTAWGGIHLRNISNRRKTWNSDVHLFFK